MILAGATEVSSSRGKTDVERQYEMYDASSDGADRRHASGEAIAIWHDNWVIALSGRSGGGASPGSRVTVAAIVK